MKKTEPCSFGEKLIATSRKLNTSCTFGYSLTVRITERYVSVKVFLKYICFFSDRGETRIVEKTDTRKLSEKIQFYISTDNFLKKYINFQTFLIFFSKIESFFSIFEKFSKTMIHSFYIG